MQTRWLRPTLLAAYVVPQLVQLMYSEGQSWVDMFRDEEPVPDADKYERWVVDLSLEDRLRALEILDILATANGDPQPGDEDEEDGKPSDDYDADDGWDGGERAKRVVAKKELEGVTIDAEFGKDPTIKSRREPELWEIGYDSEESEDEFPEVELGQLRNIVGTGEGFAGAPKSYKQKVAILLNRRDHGTDGASARTALHDRIRRRNAYLEVRGCGFRLAVALAACF